MTRTRTRILMLALIALAALTPAAPARAADPVVAAVGDMGCHPDDGNYNEGNGSDTHCRSRYVADLLAAQRPDAFLTLGDNQEGGAELANFTAVYNPMFGPANSIAYPSLGNAEYEAAGGPQGYFDYFGGAGVFDRIAALPGADTTHIRTGGYYSYDIGGWHMIALNSNCDLVGGCWESSPQEAWLRRDLAANPDQCTLAYWHHPRWNSGRLGNDSDTAAFWTALYDARADVVLNGHGNHHYERQAPQSPLGRADHNGIREFIVSTGGESHGTPPEVPGGAGTLEVADYTSYGLLRMTLRPGSYEWQFVPEAGGSFTDAGSGACHAGRTQPPSAPALTAVGSDGSVHLSWNRFSDGGAAITGYKIYRGTAAGQETLLTTVGNATSYDDSAVVNGTRYHYRVAAINGAGESPQSNAATASPTPPPPPVAFPTTAALDGFGRAPGTLGADWQSPGLQDGGTVSIDASGSTRGSGGSSTATWSRTRMPADQEAYLALRALPAAGSFVQVAGRISGLSSIGVSCYFVRVTPSTGVWDLRKKIDGGASTSLKTFTAPVVGGDAIGLRLRGQTITAFRKSGAGAWDAVGSAVDTAIAGSGYVGFTLGDTTARGGAFGGGSFSEPPPTPPAISVTDASGAEGNIGQTDLGFTVSLSKASTAPVAVAYTTQDATATAAGSDYAPAAGTLTFDAGQTTRTVSVRMNGDLAFEADETFSLELSGPTGATVADNLGLGTIRNDDVAPDLTPPAAPAGLLAGAGNGQVVLDWSDNAEPDLHHYDVYRSTVPGGPYAKANAVPLTASAYTDSGRANGTIYYYVVRAFDKVGNGSLNSAQVSAMPLAPPIVFEGETMTRSTTNTNDIRMVVDRVGSDGRTLHFRISPTTGTKQYTTTRPSDRIALRMRADLCSGGAQAAVSVDSFPAQTVTVAATAYTDYVVPLTPATGGAAGTHTLRVTYTNELKTKSCDRSLYLDKVTINQV